MTAARVRMDNSGYYVLDQVAAIIFQRHNFSWRGCVLIRNLCEKCLIVDALNKEREL